MQYTLVVSILIYRDNLNSGSTVRFRENSWAILCATVDNISIA